MRKRKKVFLFWKRNLISSWIFHRNFFFRFYFSFLFTTYFDALNFPILFFSTRKIKGILIFFFLVNITKLIFNSSAREIHFLWRNFPFSFLSIILNFNFPSFNFLLLSVVCWFFCRAIIISGAIIIGKNSRPGNGRLTINQNQGQAIILKILQSFFFWHFFFIFHLKSKMIYLLLFIFFLFWWPLKVVRVLSREFNFSFHFVCKFT